MNNMQPTKICSTCKLRKSISEFHIYKSSKDGVRNQCKLCEDIYYKKYNAINKDRIVARKRKYNIACKNNKVTQKYLKELFIYNPDTGIFTRIVDKGNEKIGSMAGYKNANGYVYISIDGKRYNASRLAFLYMEGYFPEHEVDHKNRIRNDNRWVNIRHVTKMCNSRNKSISKRNKSTITGVSWSENRGKWISSIKASKKGQFLGHFDNLKDAVQARWEAEVKYNFPNCNTTSTAYQYLQGLKDEG